jgi:DNA-binding XRE family transcriptional regulator
MEIIEEIPPHDINEQTDDMIEEQSVTPNLGIAGKYATKLL